MLLKSEEKKKEKGKAKVRERCLADPVRFILNFPIYIIQSRFRFVQNYEPFTGADENVKWLFIGEPENKCSPFCFRL